MRKLLLYLRYSFSPHAHRSISKHGAENIPKSAAGLHLCSTSAPPDRTLEKLQTVSGVHSWLPARRVKNTIDMQMLWRIWSCWICTINKQPVLTRRQRSRGSPSNPSHAVLRRTSESDTDVQSETKLYITNICFCDFFLHQLTFNLKNSFSD